MRYKKNRKAISAISLATDTSALTAIGNDFGFDYILNDNNYFNVDIKKYDLPTDVNINSGVATADVDLDPLAISIGYGWRF